MKMKWLVLPLTLFSLVQVAVAGTEPAANQSQPTSSTVTPNSASSATRNAIVAGSAATINGQTITVNSVSPQGLISMSIEVTSQTTGQKVSIPATARVTAVGQVTVIFNDGSTTTFNASEFQ
ncbi:hypothetical protein [Thiomicrorhabdus sediminis]|uniref:Uncharacterized protein n=1 Tax=Thiomicrorhabdus sediminis TaxID=2580412 RepID=A0A4P9K4F2_9GAMM|nr:hypothetical protein [Thiomicrorhabdus sediminis]QCU89788.1 hypothetical protein FE785_03610 [Thiomicrorhabdus sediminis]